MALSLKNNLLAVTVPRLPVGMALYKTTRKQTFLLSSHCAASCEADWMHTLDTGHWKAQSAPPGSLIVPAQEETGHSHPAVLRLAGLAEPWLKQSSE